MLGKQKTEKTTQSKPVLQQPTKVKVVESHDPTNQDLLKDALFMIQGIASFHFTFDSSEKEAGKATPLSRPVKQILEALTTLGGNYKFISTTLEGKAHTSTQQALFASIRTKMTTVNYNIASLQTSKGLTLRKLYLWTRELDFQLDFFSRILKEQEPLNALYKFSMHGCEKTRGLAKDLLNDTEKPLKVFIAGFLQGQIVESREFFVRQGEGSGWRSGLVFDVGKVPKCVDKDVARRIFELGRTVAFLKVCGSEERGALPGDWETWEQLGRQVDEAYGKLSLRLLSVMESKFGIGMHLQALKNYLLLGAGDFVTSLITELGCVYFHYR